MNNNLLLQPSANEQYMLELINRARSNPNAEAANYGLTDLNQGLPSGTITSDPKQPLAFNLSLIDSARGHSQWISDNNTFSHTGEGGSDPGQRMTAAGYNFTGSWGWGENLAWQGTTGTPNVSQFIADEHQSLFLSNGHRKNILKDSFREIGIGVIEDTFNNYNAVITTQNFAYSGSSVFLTGVAFNDLVTDDNFYTIGEGIGNIEVKAIRQSDNQIFTTHTMDAGGYQIALNAGTYDIEFLQNGAKIGSTHTVTLNSQNVKLDLDTSNIDVIDVLDVGPTAGSDLLNGTNAEYEQINGLAGNDTLFGLGGADELLGGNDNDLLNGGEGQDTLNGNLGDDKLNGGNHNDLLNGGEGQDTLNGNFGNDKLNGGNDNDLLNGGAGQDTLTGGTDMDLFVIQPDMGQDLIQDFEDGVDRIALSGNLSFGHLDIFGDSVISATIIQDNRTNDVLAVLSGVDSSLITEADFTTI